MKNQGPLLDPLQIKMARARSIIEWLEIYLEVLEMQLRMLERNDPEAHTQAFAAYQQSSRPALRRVAVTFQSAGLDLVEEMDVEWIDIVPYDGKTGIPLGDGRAVVFQTNPPKVRYIWPDGSDLIFTGSDAIHSVGFFVFWQTNQGPVLSKNPEGNKRILTGGTEYDTYFKAKKADQEQGLEPDQT